jgi:hypothetical protein
MYEVVGRRVLRSCQYTKGAFLMSLDMDTVETQRKEKHEPRCGCARKGKGGKAGDIDISSSTDEEGQVEGLTL